MDGYDILSRTMRAVINHRFSYFQTEKELFRLSPSCRI